MRSLYVAVVQIHPRQFRERFAEEMLWIYDQSPTARERLFFFSDGLQSFAVQWFIRSGMWKFAVAVLIAMLQVLFMLPPW